ncbi:MAG: hypothetical protein ABI270_09110 [Nitrosospira sp.]
MTKYVPYIRTEQGYIERKDYAIFNAYGSVSPYVHKEALAGWPEPMVFWDHPAGASVGLAPLPSAGNEESAELDLNHKQ